MAKTSSKGTHVGSSLVAFELAEETDPGLTAFAGLPLVVETWHALGMPDIVERELRLKKYDRGPSEAEWVELMTVLPLTGAKTVEDLKTLKQDSGLTRLWPVLGKVSPRSALDFLERFHDPKQEGSTPGKAVIRVEPPALVGLGKVNQRLLAEIQRHKKYAEATLDIDASVHACRKREALHSYEGPRAYQPVIAVWAETQLVVFDQFRDGNVPAGMGNLEVVRQALSNLPTGITTRRIRGDSALYEKDVLAFLADKAKIEFAISADVSQELRKEIEALPPSAWKPYKNRDGIVSEEGRMWAEVSFVPEDDRPKDAKPLRYLAIRYPQQGELFKDVPRRYGAVVTNRWTMEGNALINWHREKCGTVEYLHDLLKNDLGARCFPSGKYGVNAGWYRFNVLANNLRVACAVLALGDAEWARIRPSTFAFRFIRKAGRVISHARTSFLMLCTLSAPLLPIYEAARARLAALPSG